MGDWLGEAVIALCESARVGPSRVEAIGSHGHTVWHEPPSSGRSGATLQLGDAARIAERTGIDVVHDFRARDMAAGGHGAPLVPWVDHVLFTDPSNARAIQNLGGMANVTWLAAGGREAPVAFDTGPGVALIDAATEMATSGAWTFDRDGHLGARGRAYGLVLGRLLEHPFFAETPPRSTGRETFGRPFVKSVVEELRPTSKEDWCNVIATFTELTARSIAQAYKRWLSPRPIDEVFLTGGGARNPTLVGAIARALDPLPIQPRDALKVDPDAREAMAFAVLAWAHLTGRSGNVPGATGARRSRVLGSFVPGSGR
jgi:anhydro-N-acetylmuramic acid kinase